MQLNDILEENSIKGISAKTKISEDNLEKLLAKKFDALKKVKALGFISILEREYNADLSNLREEAYGYYREHNEDNSITIGQPAVEEKKGKSPFFMFLILVLLTMAGGYFFTQFDKKNLSGLLPFLDESTINHFIENVDESEEVVNELKIANVTEAVSTNEKVATKEENKAGITSLESETIREDKSLNVTQSVTDITPQSSAEANEIKTVAIVPVKRLWFGVINMKTQTREHFSVSDAYLLDVGEKSWLVATSSAAFSLKVGENHEVFNDAQEHYFKINKQGVSHLTKSEYVQLGGWEQW